MSYIDRDKISLPEVVGHLRDHCNVHDGVLLHWLFPGKELHDGLRVLVDDKVCCSCVTPLWTVELQIYMLKSHLLFQCRTMRGRCKVLDG
jgi:hypothetical protein